MYTNTQCYPRLWLQEMETHLHRCEGKLDSLKKKETELSALYPQGVFPSELRTLQTNYMDLQRRVSVLWTEHYYRL